MNFYFLLTESPAFLFEKVFQRNSDSLVRRLSSLEIKQVSGCAAGAAQPLVTFLLVRARGKKQSGRDARKETAVGAGTRPNLAASPESLCAGAAERSSGRSGHIYIPIFYTENPHCQAHKRFIEQREARSRRKLVRRCRLQTEK